jgi:CPA2 family monovalent cation:H+ antiporter-2
MTVASGLEDVGQGIAEHAAHVSDQLGLMDELAMVLAVGLVGGLVATRLRLPPIVGFLAAGVVLGPYTPGLVADVHTAEQLGEIGVIFLMFGVGLHFSLRDLIAVRNVAVPGAIVQSLLATVLTIAVVSWFGWTVGAGLVLGLALSVASTVVLVRALMSRNLLDSDPGRIAVGWLVVEDLFSALVLVLLPVLAVSLGGVAAAVPTVDTLATALFDKTDSVLAFSVRQAGIVESAPALVGVTLANVAIVVALLPLARRIVNRLLEEIDRSGSEEMLTLAVVVVALFIAVGMAMVFAMSVALGAFFAGVIVSGSRLAHRVAEDVRPLRDIFGVLFFTSVGMLFDPMTPLRSPLATVAVLAIVLLAKPVIAAGIALVLRQSRETSLTIGAGLAQIGEFSFILATLGRTVGLLPEEAYQLIITAAIVSIAVNPLAFRAARAIGRSWEREPAFPGLASAEIAASGGPMLAADVPDVERHAPDVERRSA